jgi:hypothetical protein
MLRLGSTIMTPVLKDNGNCAPAFFVLHIVKPIESTWVLAA